MKQTASIVVGVPCLRCGKSIHADYLGVCMDCADTLGISELSNPGNPTAQELEIIEQYTLTTEKQRKAGREEADVRTDRNHPGE